MIARSNFRQGGVYSAAALQGFEVVGIGRDHRGIIADCKIRHAGFEVSIASVELSCHTIAGRQVGRGERVPRMGDRRSPVFVPVRVDPQIDFGIPAGDSCTCAQRKKKCRDEISFHASPPPGDKIRQKAGGVTGQEIRKLSYLLINA